MMENSVRGETSLMIAGVPHRLCLTLGALAKIETGLGVAGDVSLSSRLNRLNANDVLLLLQALLAGGGNPVAIEDLRDSSLHPTEVANAIASAFSLADSDT